MGGRKVASHLVSRRIRPGQAAGVNKAKFTFSWPLPNHRHRRIEPIFGDRQTNSSCLLFELSLILFFMEILIGLHHKI